MKLTWPDLRTKQCCHEHADEIFTIYPATCGTIKNKEYFATDNKYNNLEVHFQMNVYGSKDPR